MDDETISEEEVQLKGLQEEVQADVVNDDFQETLVPCPNCKEMVPTSLYCLKYGFPLYMFRHGDEGIGVELEPDKGALERVQALTKDLMNSISLKLWSVNLLK